MGEQKDHAQCNNGLLHLKTPLLESTCLTKHTGFNVFLKLENTQPSGSFKIRGVGNHCQKAVNKGFTHIVSSSGGSAGLAAAHSGRKLHVHVTTIVPETTPDIVKNKIRDEGSVVEVMGKTFDEANAYATNLAKEPGHFLVHPFDHEDVWEGHATMVHEIAESMVRKPSVMVVSVGGGGLLCGVLRGLHDVGWHDVPVVAMETQGAHAFNAAIQAGKLVTLPGITSVAKCLGAQTVCQEVLDWTKRHRILSVVVSDKEAVSACLKFADDHQMIVPPACGATLAALYSNTLKRLKEQNELTELNDVVVVVCGGTTSVEKLLALKKEFGIED